MPAILPIELVIIRASFVPTVLQMTSSTIWETYDSQIFSGVLSDSDPPAGAIKVPKGYL
jgi:hypothetical protein